MSKKISLFGLYIDSIGMSDALNFSKKVLYGKEKSQIAIFTPNIEMLEASRKSKRYKDLLNSGDLLLPDGSGLLLVAKILGQKLYETVAGIDLGEKLLEEADKGSLRVFLLGGRPDVAEKAAENIQKRLKNLKICGTHHGYISNDAEMRALIEKINGSRADIVFVCMGFPRQETFVSQNRQKLPDVRIFLCLGGSLDVWSGNLRRAPKLFRAARAEWLWRIMREPSRLPRFLASLSVFPAAISLSCKNIAQSGQISVLIVKVLHIIKQKEFSGGLIYVYLFYASKYYKIFRDRVRLSRRPYYPYRFRAYLCGRFATDGYQCII